MGRGALGREGVGVMNYTVYNCSINDLAPKPSRRSPGCPHRGSDGEIPLTCFLAPRRVNRVFIQVIAIRRPMRLFTERPEQIGLKPLWCRWFASRVFKTKAKTKTKNNSKQNKDKTKTVTTTPSKKQMAGRGWGWGGGGVG